MKPVYYENGALKMLDQTLLPTEEVTHSYTDYREIAAAIVDMIVRGAPAIGVTAGYGVYFGALEFENLPKETFLKEMETVCHVLRATRPTAVNLFWAVDRMEGVIKNNSEKIVAEITALLKTEADAICSEDIKMCRDMGTYGAELIHRKDTILTHCNAGALATADYGTALGVVRAAWEAGKEISVYADETRPFLQGARLTAYELQKDGIPVTLITDNMAGWMMKQGKIDCVVVGADRIARNGDVANKIGTYSVSILAKAHGIPFYVAAPTSTIDFNMWSGDDIVIEERDTREISHIKGQQIAPDGVRMENPAFDVTPHQNVTAIITEKGVVYPPFDLSIPRLQGE
ncbi:methylthioribose-1-phosphate isomerase [Eubacterium maltosivorans]|uniref:S-methyl-5-thioribose-1-phosphate isomerase n=1 Tax=Eubacterium maltosivorans TaxID=2041044 RepID=UPI000888DA2B|nr:S-methyl-5-thioribose-1-phosphate isomerase [Eubacterium maltosivorans]WPK81575.1 Methylthioribose-1-phosphate isomerase [Eubacterium maltosivorans]SDP62304.1 methylthioribose-1-phosphate isomerase [Eubacterium maltosivorans]